MSVWPWLPQFSRVALSHFTLDYFHGCSARKTGRLVQATVQGQASFSVMGQETCEYRPVALETGSLARVLPLATVTYLPGRGSAATSGICDPPKPGSETEHSATRGNCKAKCVIYGSFLLLLG